MNKNVDVDTRVRAAWLLFYTVPLILAYFADTEGLLFILSLSFGYFCFSLIHMCRLCGAPEKAKAANEGGWICKIILLGIFSAAGYAAEF